MSEFIISSVGLSEHHSLLLLQQLRMLRGRTEAKWSYVERACNADVTIALSHDQSSAIAYIGNVIEPFAMRMEFPLRLFGLLRMLEESEARLGDCTPESIETFSSLAEKICNQTLPVMFMDDDLIVQVVPTENCIYSNLSNIEHLVSKLAQLSASTEFTPIEESSSLPYAYSSRAVLWALSLLEPVSLERFKPGTSYRISVWPIFGEWKSSPELMRLAALFARDFATLEDGASFALVKIEAVAAFLRACSLCELGLDTRLLRSLTLKEHADLQPNGLLQRLRSRLGIGFKR